MAQLNIKLDERQIQELKRYAQGRRTSVSWLIKDYVDYLIAGGTPVGPASDDSEITSEELMLLAERGGSFDWLKDEPDIYTWEDGEPV